MEKAPITRTATHCHATIRQLLQGEDRLDQFQPQPLCRCRVFPGEESNYVLQIQISPLV